MKKQEIEQAAKEFSKQEYNGDEPVYDDEDLFWQQICYKRGAEMVNERQPYSREDMNEFLWWVRTQMFPVRDGWIWRYQNITDAKIIKADELIKLWEESKNRKEIY